ncbi:hypothetical protein ABC345_03450 [Shouchella sp. 1P09AA]|uniref:hypothetical protein n=1 Tax=unclassified Shouchella TaxID=2893065 RepID=UPI00399F6D93
MNVHIPTSGLIETVSSLFAFALFIGFFIFLYRRNTDNVSWWKALVVTFFGMLTVDFPLFIFNQEMAFPLIPLGVGIICLLAPRGNQGWLRYRPFAWTGFFSGFLFVGFSLIGAVVQYLVYPVDEISTYITNPTDIELTVTHFQGDEVELNLSEAHLERYEIKSIGEAEFFEQIMSGGRQQGEHQEDFPYVLQGAQSKWGSGYHPLIFVEKDGQGILVDLGEEQLYFSGSEPLFNGGEAP